MSRDRSTTERDAARYAASIAHGVDGPDAADVYMDERLPRAAVTAECGVCGQPCIDPLWCVVCADEKAAEMRQRNEEWWSQ